MTKKGTPQLLKEPVFVSLGSQMSKSKKKTDLPESGKSAVLLAKSNALEASMTNQTGKVQFFVFLSLFCRQTRKNYMCVHVT